MAEDKADGWLTAPVPAGQPADIDTSVAHPARVYDYWLGGKDNFAADREAGDRVLAAAPGLRERSGRDGSSWCGRCTTWPPRPGSGSF